MTVPDARNGIPQGAACSDWVAQALLAPMLHELHLGPARLLYGDNLLILANRTRLISTSLSGQPSLCDNAPDANTKDLWYKP